MGREMARAWLEAEHMVGLDPEMARIVRKNLMSWSSLRMRCTGMSDSDLFEMHKIHMLNMLKYTESIKEMTELVDKLIYLSYNTKYRNRLQFASDLEDSV